MANVEYTWQAASPNNATLCCLTLHQAYIILQVFANVKYLHSRPSPNLFRLSVPGILWRMLGLTCCDLLCLTNVMFSILLPKCSYNGTKLQRWGKYYWQTGVMPCQAEGRIEHFVILAFLILISSYLISSWVILVAILYSANHYSVYHIYGKIHLKYIDYYFELDRIVWSISTFNNKIKWIVSTSVIVNPPFKVGKLFCCFGS